MATIFDPASGLYLDPDNMPHVLTYDANGNVSTDKVTRGSSSWVRTLAWVQVTVSGTPTWKPATDSGWVKQ